MSYAQGRLIHDADSHLMELDDCLDPYFEKALLARFHASPGYRTALARNLRPGRSRAAHVDPAFRAGVDANLMLRKNYEAHGAFIPADRPHALDLMGFASQLVFTTSQAQEAGIPVLFHVGGEDKLNPVYKHNGLPAVPDFHGGDDNFTSVSYMPIPSAVMQTLATLIFDGVFDRFPRLKWGAIELGASWLPGWMRAMDSAALAFMRNETRLQKLSAKPSELVQRQLRVTPYPHEDAGWIVAQAGPEVALFSSDYPHVEGGRHPLKRFDESLQGCAPDAVQRFYADNFIDLMGSGLAPGLRRPVQLVAA